MAFERIQLLSFDCYGTLVDWETGIVEAMAPVLRTAGVDAGEEQILAAYAASETGHQQAGVFVPYRQVLRSTFRSMLSSLGVPAGEADPDTLARSLPDWPVFPDTVDALRTLAERFRLSVISNVDDDLFAQTAKRLEVPFDYVVSAASVGAYKPDLRVFQEARARFAVDRQAWLHCAQSAFHDLAPANALGLRAAWVRRPKAGAGSAVPASEARAQLEVDDLAQLARVLVPG